MTLPVPPDVLAVPAPVWLLKALLHATFFVHLLFMNLLAGGTLLEAVFAFKGQPKHLDVARRLAQIMPYVMPFTITFGVAPLLFAQVLYGPLFYTAAIVMGGPFLLGLAAVLVAYVLLYVQKRFWTGLGRARGWLALLTFALLGFMGFVWSNLSAMILEPERMPGKHLAHPGGWQLDLADPGVYPRFLHVMLGAVALAGLYVALLGVRRLALEPEQGRWQYRSGATWFAGTTLVNMAVGLWWLLALPREQMTALMGGSLAATIAFGVGFLAALMALAHSLLGVNSLKPAPMLWGAAGALLATILAMVLVRDAVRDAALKEAYPLASLPVGPQWGAIALFLALFAAGVGTCAWMLRVMARARKIREDGLVGPGLTDSGLHKISPEESGFYRTGGLSTGARRAGPPSTGARRLDDEAE